MRNDPQDARADSLPWLDGGRPLELIALIHATVELERALDEHGASAELAASASNDPLLGATVVLVEGTPRTAIAEPSTEGRLAATLARHGEGVAGRYLRSPVELSLGEIRSRAAIAGVSLSATADGPFGPEVLVLGRSSAGPHIVLVEVAAVPSRR